MSADIAVQASAVLAAVFVASALAAAACWRLTRTRMQRPRWVRENYRGRPIPSCSGLLVVAVGTLGAAFVGVMAYRIGGHAHDSSYASVSATGATGANGATGAALSVLALLMFGWLGYRDDTRGDSDPGGFAAHFRRSWQQRRLTTGAQKALGGAVAALLCVRIGLFGDISALWARGGWEEVAAAMRSLGDVFIGSHHGWELVPWLRGALIVALGANLLNLFDRAPGRATKVALAWWLLGLLPAALANSALQQTWQSPALWAAAAVGASVGLLRSELREAHMQGDTGVNATGAVLALSTVAMASAAIEWILLAVLVGLNLSSERWSFSRIIDTVPLLRWLDRLGSPYRS